MSSRQHPRSKASLHKRRQLHEAQGIRDLRPRACDPLRELRMRAVEVLEQLLVSSSLLQRIELDPMQVLQESIPE